MRKLYRLAGEFDGYTLALQAVMMSMVLKNLSHPKNIARELTAMNEKGESQWKATGKDKEWHLSAAHQYIFMKQYIYSGLRKRTMPYNSLTVQELLEIWFGDWQSTEERKRVLVHFGRQMLYDGAKKAFKEEFLSVKQ